MNSIKFKCKSCGGTCGSDGKCIYCGHKVDELDNKDKYDKLLANYDDIINNNFTLSDEEYKIIINGFLSNNIELSNELKDMFTNILSKKLVEDGKIFTTEEKEKMFKSFIDMIARRNNLDNKIKVLFNNSSTDLEHECKGVYIAEFDTISLSRNLLDTNPIEAYSTVFHELTHVRQNKEISKDKKMSALVLYEIMDEINRKEIGNSYYDENYNYLPSELEALRFQYLSSIEYFRNLNVEIPTEIVEKANKYEEICSKLINSEYFSYRKVGDKVYPINYLCARNIADKPEYLSEYPQLNICFKVKNNSVFDKSSEELKQDFSHYIDDNSMWNGSPDEINQLYINMISNTKYIEEQLSNYTIQEETNINNKIKGYSNIVILIFINMIICIGIVIIGTLLN